VDRKHQVRACVSVCACVLAKDCKGLSHISVPMQGLGEGDRERSTHQENCYTKHAVTNRLPLTVSHGIEKEAPILRIC